MPATSPTRCSSGSPTASAAASGSPPAGQDPPLYRPKGFADDATPRGNGVAAQALARLGWLTGETRYLDAAEAAVRGAGPSFARAPEAHAAMLNALDEYLDPVEIVVIRGGGRGGRVLAGGSSHAVTHRGAWSSRFPPMRPGCRIRSLPSARERTVAYVCRGPVCSDPSSLCLN